MPNFGDLRQRGDCGFEMFLKSGRRSSDIYQRGFNGFNSAKSPPRLVSEQKETKCAKGNDRLWNSNILMLST
jgi:hypothetical protein